MLREHGQRTGPQLVPLNHPLPHWPLITEPIVVSTNVPPIQNHTPVPVILCKIARMKAESLDLKTSEQFGPAISLDLSDHDARDEHLFSLFQVPELSQPI